MIKFYTPFKLINYLSKEFFKSFGVVFLVFFSLSLLINFVEEITFFKDKEIQNFTLFISYLSISKTPNTIIELFIFIILFTGIIFFVKLQKSNEINTIMLSGISKTIPILVPGLISFFLGVFILFVFSPISSTSLKFYEETKRLFSSNDNLVVINDNGLWFKENLENGYNIIRANKILNNDFTKLTNVTIYNLDKSFNFIKRLDSDEIIIKNKNWMMFNTKVLNNQTDFSLKDNNYSSDTEFVSTININNLKKFFSNANTVSFWEIGDNIKVLNERGYSADELKVKLHKYLSLPIFLLAMILVSTIFTISINKEYNTLMYLFFGIIIGFIIYFFNDLSIAVGLANKLPLIMSVWSPVIIIMFLSIINLMRINEK